MVGQVHQDRAITLPPFEGGVRNPKREELAAMLQDNSNATHPPITIKNIFPKFIKITNKGGADPISKFMGGPRINDNGNVLIILSCINQSNLFTIKIYKFISFVNI